MGQVASARSKIALKVTLAGLALSAAVGACADQGTDRPGARVEVSDETRRALAAGEARAIVVGLQDDVAVDPREVLDDAARAELVALRDEAYREAAERVVAALSADATVVRSYDHLPYLQLQLRSDEALARLATFADVDVVIDDAALELGDVSAARLDQLGATLAGRTAGATIAVLGSGIDYRAARFGACAAAAADGCRVVFADDLATDDAQLDDDGRGTELAAAVLDYLPEVDVASLDVVADDGRAATSQLLAGIDWSIAHRDDLKVAGVALAGHAGVRSQAAARMTRNAGDDAGSLATPPMATGGGAPTGGTIVINVAGLPNNPPYSNTLTVTLALNAVGATQMCVSNTSTCTAWGPYAPSKNWTLTTTNGTKTVRVWYRNDLLETAGAYQDTIMLDRSVPVSGTLSSIPQFTMTPVTEITFTWLASACSGIPVPIRFYVDGQLAADVQGDTGSCACSPGIRSVTVTDPNILALLNSGWNWYDVQYDSGGQTYEMLAWAVATIQGQDIVIYDVYPWGDALTRNSDLCSSGYYGGYVYQGSSGAAPDTQDWDKVLLSWNGWLDNHSGLASYKLSTSTSGYPANCNAIGTGNYNIPLGNETFALTGLTEGGTVYARLCALDNAGNMSLGKTISATLAENAPPPNSFGSWLRTGLELQYGADVFSANTVSLQVYAQNQFTPWGPPAEMCISNTATCAATAWQPFSYFVSSWPLTTGSGLKTVYARFRDARGKVSQTPVVDTITVDVSRPTNGRLSATTGGGAVHLNWSGFTDLGSGIQGYRITRTTGFSPPTYCTGTDLNLQQNNLTFDDTTGTSGTTYIYRVCAVDQVGLASSGLTISKTFP